MEVLVLKNMELLMRKSSNDSKTEVRGSFLGLSGITENQKLLKCLRRWAVLCPLLSEVKNNLNVDEQSVTGV